MEKKRERRSVRKGPGVSRFARGLLAEWKRLGLALAGERVIVAVSGGADSTALLLALDELRRAELITPDVTVAHLDHGLRGEEGAADARWVSELAAKLGFDAEMGCVAVGERAALSRDNLEQAARGARYEFLAGAAVRWQARSVLTGHTMDDQAETVLLRLMRGSGALGLSGIETVRALDQKSEVLLVRLLLRWARRAMTEEYCRERGMEVRVDAMNVDERYARVRVRRNLLPLMMSFNRRVVEAISRSAELLRDETTALGVVAERLLDEASAGASELDEIDFKHASDSSPLRVDVLRDAPRGLRRCALRLWIARGRGDMRRLELVHLIAVEALLEGSRGGRVAELPGGARVYRKRGWLWLLTKRVEKGAAPV
ncbi:MAG TPA: tRNA lysidine(34) synthetase TilS [Pyrinomonadaceae bacterium]|nr:tRNA lysidine(34) synthetase TilS [Pyrinomonadaceae bacterium]